MCEPPVELADGVPFQLGMDVFLPVGGVLSDGDIRRIPTSEAEHEIEPLEYDGRNIPCLKRIGSPCSTDLRLFYGSRETILDARIAALDAQIASDLARLAHLRTERNCGS